MSCERNGDLSGIKITLTFLNMRRRFRDRYIRERRLYKESLQEGAAKIPKWPLYQEFSFLDLYVDQNVPNVPRHHQAVESNDNESVHSDDNKEEDKNVLNLMDTSNDNEEADQSSPSSSSTPSTSTPGQSNIILQLLQRISQNTDNHPRWPLGENGANNLTNVFHHQPTGNSSSSLETNSTLLSEYTQFTLESLLLESLAILMQNSNFRFRNGLVGQTTMSTIGDGVNEVLGELRSCITKLTNISNDISENGLEYSFGQYVACELARTSEPRRRLLLFSL